MQIEHHTEIARLDRKKTLGESVFMAVCGPVEGDIAEFGISNGNSFKTLATSIARCSPYDERLGKPPRVLHGFDSFEGLPAATQTPDTESPMVKSGIWSEGTCGSPGILAIMNIGAKHLPADRIVLHPGWFADTLPNIEPGQKFALVHLDCDLYQSTKEVLTYLLSNNHLSDGCVILFDDFLENRGSKKFGQRRAWEEIKSTFNVDYTDLGYYARACWRCIVHLD